MNLIQIFQGPITKGRATGCLIANLFLTPGLGSLMGRRYPAAAGQLSVFLVGFGLFAFWALDTIRQYYQMIQSDITPHLHPLAAICGGGLCIASWLWSLFTSLSLLREAKRNEREAVLSLNDQPPLRL